MMIEQHFVTFVSPGTFVPETTTRPIPAWDTDEATSMASGIVERHGARPYSFFFTTRRNDEELDSREVARSCHYFLGGTVLSLADVKARNDPADRMLIQDMEGKGIDRVVENCNSYRAVLPLSEEDVVLEFSMAPKGGDAEWTPEAATPRT